MLSLCHFREYRDNTGSDTFQSEDVTALKGCPISKSQDSPDTYFRGLRLRVKGGIGIGLLTRTFQKLDSCLLLVLLCL